jgi:hypothetical protein
VAIGDLAHARIVPVARVGAGAGNEEARAKELGIAVELIIVDETVVGAHGVGHRLEVDRRGRDLLAVGLVAVRQMAARRQIEAHDAVVRLERAPCRLGNSPASQSAAARSRPTRQDRGRTAQEHAFGKAIQLCRQLKQTRNTSKVNETIVDARTFGATVIALTGNAFGVFVGQARTQCLQNSIRREILNTESHVSNDIVCSIF